MVMCLEETKNASFVGAMFYNMAARAPFTLK
jgi:hypothetical protein